MDNIIVSVSIAIVAVFAALVLVDASNNVGSTKKSKIYRIAAGAILILIAACEYLLVTSGTVIEKPKNELSYPVKEETSEDKPSDPLNMADIEESIAKYGRIATLRKTNEWQKFAAFWHKLDSMDTDYNYNASEISYHELTAEKIRILGDLDNLYYLYLSTELLSYEEKSILSRIVEIRIDQVRAAGKITSRMLMSDVNYVDSNKSTVVRDLESKIDTLQELREKEAIDSEEINQALEIIKEDIKIAILLDEILNTYPEYHDTMGTDNESGIPNMETVERYFVEIGKDYSKYSSQKEADIYMTSPQNQTSASKQEILLEYQKNEYAALKEKLNKINEIYPTFEKLIDDLEG